MSEQEKTTKEQIENLELVNQVFEDEESKRNLVGLYDLLYKIDRRNNPDLYKHNNNNYDRHSNSSNT